MQNWELTKNRRGSCQNEQLLVNYVLQGSANVWQHSFYIDRLLRN